MDCCHLEVDLTAASHCPVCQHSNKHIMPKTQDDQHRIMCRYHSCTYITDRRLLLKCTEDNWPGVSSASFSISCMHLLCVLSMSCNVRTMFSSGQAKLNNRTHKPLEKLPFPRTFKRSTLCSQERLKDELNTAIQARCLGACNAILLQVAPEEIQKRKFGQMGVRWVSICKERR